MFGNTEEGGGFLAPGVTSGSPFRTNDKNRWDTGRAWTHHTIDLPRTWSVFGAQVRQEKKVGMIDDMKGVDP